MPIAGPIGFGSLIPASRKISKEIANIKPSIIAGNGTPCLASIIEMASSVGINPGWKEMNEIYSAGAIRATKAAKNRKIRNNVPGIHLS
ncbi:hypothetical protein D3C76_1275320 [compost metagenome]